MRGACGRAKLVVSLGCVIAGCLIGPRQSRATAFAITNIAVVNDDVVLRVAHGSAGLTYAIIAADNNAALPPLSLTQIANPVNGAFSYSDSGVLSSPSITSRYYQLVEINGTTSTTNQRIWLIEKQQRAPNRWHMASVPVRHALYGLSNELGRALAQGLQGNSSEMTSPQLYLWQHQIDAWTNFWLHSSTNWYASGEPANYAIEPGVGFWLKTPTNPPATQQAAFVGPSHTNSTDITFSSNRWSLFAWPYARPRAEADGTEGRKGWDFLAQGAHGGDDFSSADKIFMEHDGRYLNLYLGTNGRWYIQNTVNLADVCVVHGKAYYYFAAGTTFVWRASEVVEIPDSEDDPPPASDQDQLPDAWEQQWFGNLAQGDEDDPDADEVNNLEEYYAGTDPTLANLNDLNNKTALLVFTP